MSRIEGSNIQFGSSFVVGQAGKSLQSEADSQLILDSKKQAEDILAQAKLEAQQILDSTAAEAQNILEQTKNEAFQEGYKQGSEEGYSAGYTQVHNDLTEVIKSMDVIAGSAFDVKKEIIASSEEQILRLSITIAEKIVRHTLDVSDETILNIIKAAIGELKDKEEISIVVNPKLTKTLYDFSDELKNTINGLNKIKIIEDKTVKPDGAIIESPDSRIDARLDTQIAEITRQILEEAKQNPAIGEILPEIEIKIEEPPAIKERRKKKDA